MVLGYMLRVKRKSGKSAFDFLKPAKPVLKIFHDAFGYEIACEDNTVISNAVVAFQALFPAVYNTVVVHQGEMFRNVGLTCADFVDDFLDSSFSFAECSENFKTHWLRKQLESVGDCYQHLFGHSKIPFFYLFFVNSDFIAHQYRVGSVLSRVLFKGEL